MQKFVFGIVFILLTKSLAAQIPIFSQVEIPENPAQNTWHFNPQSTALSIFKGKAWEIVPIKNIRLVEEWEKHVKITTADEVFLAQANAKILLANCHWLLRKDRLFFAYVCGSGTMVLNLEGDSLAHFGMKDFRMKIPLDTIQNQEVICAPKFVPNMKRVNADRMHNWGMLNLKGEWLIEPRFDSKFSYENQIAEVKLLGKLIRIDEFGEVFE